MAGADVAWEPVTSNLLYFERDTGGLPHSAVIGCEGCQGCQGYGLRQGQGLADALAWQRLLSTRAPHARHAGRPTTGGWRGVLAGLSKDQQAQAQEEMLRVGRTLLWRGQLACLQAARWRAPTGGRAACSCGNRRGGRSARHSRRLQRGAALPAHPCPPPWRAAAGHDV